MPCDCRLKPEESSQRTPRSVEKVHELHGNVREEAAEVPEARQRRDHGSAWNDTPMSGADAVIGGCDNQNQCKKVDRTDDDAGGCAAPCATHFPKRVKPEALREKQQREHGHPQDDSEK